MRKILLGLVATAALAAPLAAATAANASVAFDGSTGHVDKGDIQSALGWNNGDFDKGVSTLKFTAGSATAEKVTQDYPMLCLNFATGDMSTVGHRLFVQPGTVSADVTAKPVLNSNGKQITGFDLTSTPGAFKAVGNAVVRDTGCEGGALFMNTGTPSQPNTVTVTGAASGLFVSGNGKTVALPNTPVPAPVV
jgi:hypothetical protein